MKSTQNAFIFNPYRKLAKLSLNLDKLSCMICMSPMLTSSVVIASESSANAGSSALRGKASSVGFELTREPREERRRGVGGRDGGREPGLRWEDDGVVVAASAIVTDMGGYRQRLMRGVGGPVAKNRGYYIILCLAMAREDAEGEVN